MQRKTVLGIVVAVLIVGSVTDVFESDDKDDKKGGAAKGKPTAAASAPAKPGKGSKTASKAVSAFPSPNPAQTKDLLKRLGKIHPYLAAKEVRSVSRARNVCNDLRHHKGDTTGVSRRAAAYFSGGDVPNLSPAQGARIVTAVRKTFCP